VAEEYRLGGTCVIRGCVPKKLMVYASRFPHEFADAAGFGWSVEGVRFDWTTLRRNRDAEVARLERIYRSLLDGSEVQIFDERAVIEGPEAVRLGSGRVVTAKHILISVGGHPTLEPPIEGSELAITSNEVFELDSLPERILVVGGGYIAVEFAGIFAGLGSKTTLLHRGDKLLRGFDEDLRDALGDAYAKQGIGLVLGRTIDKMERVDGAIRVTLSDGQTLAFDQVLVATGRRPNTRHLGLDNVGIATDKVGAIPVDAFSRSTVPSIYAVGDVTNRANLTPIAIREGHAFADTVFGAKPWCVDHTLIPTAVFSTPEIGTIGHCEMAARALYGDITIYKASFRPMKATLSGSDERVLMKLIVETATDRVVGVHIMGHDAAEMIQLAGVAVGMGATKADFDRTVAVHPTAAEELVTMRVPFITKHPVAVG
jgi:glutathione reductase (NADPH)